MAPNKWTVEAINQRLKASSLGVALIQRGQKLSLRAVLPPKPRSNKVIWHQQTVSLGIYANPAGLQRAESEAKIMAGKLAAGDFDWSDYIEIQASHEEVKDAGTWIEKFERDYFARRGDTPQTRGTWKSDYVPAFSLIADASITSENLIAATATVPANTRKRKLVCEKFTALAKFASVEVDLSPYVGCYGVSETNPRYIPTKQEIEFQRTLLDRRQDWQWAYGVLAAYGLRPHEIFFCKISPDSPYLLKVLRGKTGSREVYPYHPQWVIEWELHKPKLPPATGKTFKDYGNRVNKTFSRNNIIFTPYCLRHAYCIRLSTEYHVPVPVAATWTGHEAPVFLKVYNRWISRREEKRVYEESLKLKTEY